MIITIGMRKALKILLGVFIMWLVFFVCDFSLASHHRDPVFCLTREYISENDKDYLGLFYRIKKEVAYTDENGEEVITYVLMPWFSDDLKYHFSIGSYYDKYKYK